MATGWTSGAARRAVDAHSHSIADTFGRCWLVAVVMAVGVFAPLLSWLGANETVH